MKKKLPFLFTLGMLSTALVGCGKAPEVKQLTITMIPHNDIIFYIAQLPNANTRYGALYDDYRSKMNCSNSVTVDYTVGDTYRDVFMNSIFIIEPERMNDHHDPETWIDDIEYIEFCVYCLRYGHVPHFSLKADMTDVFYDWSKEVTGNQLYIECFKP